jgi:hypothetical protein
MKNHFRGPSRRDLGRWLALLMMQSGSSSVLDGQSERAEARTQAGAVTLSNTFLKASWSASNRRLRALTFADSYGRTIPLPRDVFSLGLEGGRILKSSEMALESPPGRYVFRETPNLSAAPEHGPASL